MIPEPLKYKYAKFIKEGDGKVNYDGYYAIPLEKYECLVENIKDKIINEIERSILTDEDKLLITALICGVFEDVEREK